MKSLRAHFDGKVIVPDDPVELPTGRALHVYVIAASETPPGDNVKPGTPAALLRFLREGPHISPELAAELEQAIDEGRLPATDRGVFDEEG